MIDGFGWLIGLHVVMAIFLGLLAFIWKGRNAWVWVGVGLTTSLVGVIVLAGLPRLVPIIEGEMQYQHMDGTRMQ